MERGGLSLGGSGAAPERSESRSLPHAMQRRGPGVEPLVARSAMSFVWLGLLCR